MSAHLLHYGSSIILTEKPLLPNQDLSANWAVYMKTILRTEVCAHVFPEYLYIPWLLGLSFFVYGDSDSH